MPLRKWTTDEVATVTTATSWLRNPDTGSKVLLVSFGTRLPYLGTSGGETLVATPGGTEVAVPAGNVSVHDPAAPALAPSGHSLVRTAKQFTGLDYLWAGRSGFGFDCSGFTKRAYARAGLRLPHSSGAQAARARIVSRAAARPGDLVVGPGHVGIYMGGGMMIDAGNPRTGVVYRRLYAGLHIERF